MKVFKKIMLWLLIGLSIASGMVKLFKMPTEMELFREAGFSDIATIIFGVIQVIGGVILIFPSQRKIGAIIMAITFSIATGVLFINAQMFFGSFSIIFIAMALLFVKPINTKLNPLNE